MDKVQAEESIKVIRDIMERSAGYTIFSGLSGIIAGLLSLIGCYLSEQVWAGEQTIDQNAHYLIIWFSILALAIVQDRVLAERKARKSGQTTWTPATYQAIKAILPGMCLAFALSLRALIIYDYDAIPAICILGYAVSLCAAGMFSIYELRVFGVVQLVTGVIALFLPLIPRFNHPQTALYFMALSFGVYHIIYGLIMWRKYGW